MITRQEQVWLAIKHGQSLDAMTQLAEDNPTATLKVLDEAIQKLVEETDRFHQLTAGLW